MKKTILFIAILFISVVSFGQKNKKPDYTIYNFADTNPEYELGALALKNELQKSYQIPISLLKNFSSNKNVKCKTPVTKINANKSLNIEECKGVITVRFEVKPDGSIGFIEVLKGLGKVADKNAIKAVESLTHQFDPALKDGEPVSVWYVQPIEVRLTSIM